MAREVEQLRIITNAKIAKCGIQKQLPEGHDGPEVAGSSKVRGNCYSMYISVIVLFKNWQYYI